MNGNALVVVLLAVLLAPPALAAWLLVKCWQLSRGIADAEARPAGWRWVGLLALTTLACLALIIWLEFLFSLSGPAHSSRSSGALEAHFYGTLTKMWLLGTCFALVLLAWFRRWRVAGCFEVGLLLALATAAGWWRSQPGASQPEYVTLAPDELPNSEPKPGGQQAAVADSLQQRKLAGTVFEMGQVEYMPTFPGGAQALGDAIAALRRLPAKAENRVAGRVVVAFVVEADGRVALPHVTAGLGAAYDAEAVRIVRNLCCFTPGIRQARPVAVVWTCDVSFE